MWRQSEGAMKLDAVTPRSPNSAITLSLAKSLSAGLPLCYREQKSQHSPHADASHGLRTASRDHCSVICYCQADQLKVIHSETKITFDFLMVW